MIRLTAKPEDDSAFVEIVSRIARKLIAEVEPARVFIVQIDGWFGHKWLAFSGKILGAVPVWNSTLTIPPFHPNRVIDETHATISKDKAVAVATPPVQSIHRDQPSVENTRRKIIDLTESAIFVWYSGNTKNADRASLMVYTSTAQRQMEWYASFLKESDWKIDQVKGLGRQALTSLVACDGD
jgi:hypothetical protein